MPEYILITTYTAVLLGQALLQDSSNFSTCWSGCKMSCHREIKKGKRRAPRTEIAGGSVIWHVGLLEYEDRMVEVYAGIERVD
jgi:hypothetical protein